MTPSAAQTKLAEGFRQAARRRGRIVSTAQIMRRYDEWAAWHASLSTPDRELAVDEAADLLGIKARTVRGYLCSGRLTRLGAGVSEASVTGYARRRKAIWARTRFQTS